MNTENLEIIDDYYSNVDGATNDAISAGIDLTGTLLANRDPSRRTAKKELKDVCGRKPLLKNKKEAWQKCANAYYASKNQPLPTEQPVIYDSRIRDDYREPEGMNPALKWGLIGLATITVGVLGYLAIKKLKK